MYKNTLNFNENSIYFDITENITTEEEFFNNLSELKKDVNFKNIQETNNFYINFLTKYLGEENYKILIGNYKPTLLNHLIIFKELLTTIDVQKEVYFETININNELSLKLAEKNKQQAKKSKKYIDKIK